MNRLFTGLNFNLATDLPPDQMMEIAADGILYVTLDGRPILSGAACLLPVNVTETPAWRFMPPHKGTADSTFEATLALEAPEEADYPPSKFDVAKDIGFIMLAWEEAPPELAAGWPHAFRTEIGWVTVPVKLKLRTTPGGA